MTIMGGFEIANEMMRMIDIPEWKDAWLDHAARYKKKAWELSHSRFRVSRLMAYAAYHLRNTQMAEEAWKEFVYPVGTYTCTAFPHHYHTSAGSTVSIR